MNSRQRVIKTLNMEGIDRVPRDLWALPGILMSRKNEYDEVINKYPSDFTSPDIRYGVSRKKKGIPNVKGTYTDDWGCIFTCYETGIIGEVKDFVISDLSDIDKYELPFEILDEADLSRVNRSCEETDLFVKAGTHINPFERMQYLRGTQNLFMDLAYGDKSIYVLRDKLHEFYIRELEMLVKTDVDGIAFMDDWGTQKDLLISPQIWREFFKPLYKDYCDIIKAKGKYVFFHSDGNIEKIYPDLIEIGVDALNSQLFCMNMEELGEKYSGKITFWGEIDRQYLLPFGSKEEVRRGVERVADALFKKRTGVIAQCEWGLNDPKENIEEVFNTWDRIGGGS